MILYGIPSCDTCRKARKALEGAGHEVIFRDVRRETLTPAERAEFISAFGERILNRASTTWRNLGEGERQSAPDALLASHPTLMKRPVIRHQGKLHLGWGRDVQAALL